VELGFWTGPLLLMVFLECVIIIDYRSERPAA
jgi:hypothetical protein